MQRFTGEVAAVVPRNLDLSSANLKSSNKISSILLYSRPGELLLGVAVSRLVLVFLFFCMLWLKYLYMYIYTLRARPNYIVIASELGTRDVNVDSSIRYRERTPDGRGLLDSDYDSWQGVFARFRDKELLNETAGGGSWDHVVSAGGAKRIPSGPQSGGGGGGGGATPARQNASHVSLAPVPDRPRSMTGHKALAKALSKAPPMGVQIGHSESATSVASHPVLSYYCSGNADGALFCI